MSTSVKLNANGITNSEGKLITVVEAAPIPVGEVNTNVWLEFAPIFADVIVSDIFVRAAAKADPTPRTEIREKAAVFIKAFLTELLKNLPKYKIGFCCITITLQYKPFLDY
jgi:hypothetical protein